MPTVPITGTVLVNDLPAPGVSVTLHALDDRTGEALHTARPYGMTEGDGRFAISTYVHGDGAAVGDYAITLEWLNYNAFRNQYGGPDKLGGKYSDPKKSEFKVTVTGDEENGIDLAPFDLKK